MHYHNRSMKIIFATNNAHKLEEAQQILGSMYSLITPRDCGITEDIPEDRDTIEGNALQKARYVYDKTRMNCFADDTGLEVEALDGAPGVRSARYAGDGHDFAENTRLLLSNLSGKDNRSARFRTVIALILDGKEYLFEGEVRGRITEEPAGGQGFGYDPVFIPEGYSETFAQMDPVEKNRISHRGEAVAKLARFLMSADPHGEYGFL